MHANSLTFIDENQGGRATCYHLLVTVIGYATHLFNKEAKNL